jgi:hypothetical protein
MATPGVHPACQTVGGFADIYNTAIWKISLQPIGSMTKFQR